MTKNMRMAALVLIASVAIVFSGCSEKRPAPKPAAPKPKTPAAAKAGNAKPEEKVEQEVYIYEAKGRRDPFMSLAVVARQKPHVRKANPVENYDVNEIGLSAILWDSNGYYALVTLPDGKSYTITKGMTLGLYGGKVQDISKNSVLIREQIKDYRGQLKTKDTLLKLRPRG